MDRPSANGGTDLKAVMAGIRLVLEEIRDLKIEAAQERREAAQDRKLFEHYFKRAEEDRETQREWMEEVRREAAEDRRRFNRTLRIMVHVARDIRDGQHKQTAILERNTAILEHNSKILEEHTNLLHDISRSVRGRSNGSKGNGK